MKLEDKIQIESEKIKIGNPKIKLLKPCRIQDGINSLNKEDEIFFEKLFEKIKHNKKITFFIPSSGSGSRMFEELHLFLSSKNDAQPKTLKFIEQLLNNIEKFAFYNKLPKKIKQELKTGEENINELLEFILYENGLGYSNLPKGLIPFHLYGKFIINPFQEQILQGSQIVDENTVFHFTINSAFQNKIKTTIEILKEITGIDFIYEFSEQEKETNSIAFDENLNPIKIEEECLMKPSGHGALLNNLNKIDSDIIFIKNIDNIQHLSKSKTTIKTKKALGGILIDFQSKVFDILRLIDENKDYKVDLSALNNQFNLNLTDSQIADKIFIFNLLNRPIRVCGLVKNEGQPGGGPFWVQEENSISKQIIEKSQILNDVEQLSILLKSTHFNPVDIVCGVKNYNGEKFDLFKYNNEKNYFIAEKIHEGKKIKFIENPGLWNGGMFNWFTLFYEIDSKCFSPVKTILDLLTEPHVENI